MGIRDAHDYPTTFAVHCVMTAVTLAANTPVKVLSANANRKLLTVQNTGNGGPLSFGFATLTPGQGISLDAASVAGGEGGSYEFKDVMPMDEIWAVSLAGTTMVVMEGV